jgi:hypothetical protein
MSRANPTWGSPRITAELAKIGIVVAKSTVQEYMVRRPGPPSPTWCTILNNHVTDLVSIDLFVVPTVMFNVLYVLGVLAHDRRRLVHFNVTASPTAQWTALQVVEAVRGIQHPDASCVTETGPEAASSAVWCIPWDSKRFSSR